MAEPYNFHNHTREGVDLEIKSWGGEYIHLHYLPDGVSIMLLLDEIDPLIEALKEAKEAQELPGRKREDKRKIKMWNQAVRGTWANDPTAGGVLPG